jgi:hypothetical protein
MGYPKVTYLCYVELKQGNNCNFAGILKQK